MEQRDKETIEGSVTSAGALGAVALSWADCVVDDNDDDDEIVSIDSHWLQVQYEFLRKSSESESSSVEDAHVECYFSGEAVGAAQPSCVEPVDLEREQLRKVPLFPMLEVEQVSVVKCNKEEDIPFEKKVSRRFRKLQSVRRRALNRVFGILRQRILLLGLRSWIRGATAWRFESG